MIVSPSITQVLRGVIHELGGTLKSGITDPTKIAQIDTMIGVLGSCAVRANHQSQWMLDESTAIITLAEAYQTAGKSNAVIDAALTSVAKASNDMDRYEAASQALSSMSDIGISAGDDLYAGLFSLMETRLANEMNVIGGGFEAAGRG
jgi:uncharacterized protein YdaL